MYLSKLSLKGFRNYSHKELSFINGNNIFIGINGVGKTNLLEAIFLLSMTKSFRKVLDIDLVKRGKEFYFLEGFYKEEDQTDLEHRVSLSYYKHKKQLKYNASVISRLSDIIGRIRIVSFLQEDINLIFGSPSLRRKYLDLSLSLSYPLYFKELRSYNRIIKQRNATLRNIALGVSGKDLLAVWNEQLIESAVVLLKMRYSFFEPINIHIKDLYNVLGFDISGFNLSYKSSIGNTSTSSTIKDKLREVLALNEDRELIYKQSLFGPHKDDFLIQSDGIDFARFASQGQSRACALTLKLAIVYYIESIVNKKSILLLDDVLLDLDAKKKDKFFTLIEGRQNFFTSTSLYGFSSIEDTAFVLCLP